MNSSSSDNVPDGEGRRVARHAAGMSPRRMSHVLLPLLGVGRRCEMMDAYVLEILIHERIADAQQHAARQHLLRGARAPRARNSLWALVLRLVRAASAPRLKSRHERVAVP